MYFLGLHCYKLCNAFSENAAFCVEEMEPHLTALPRHGKEDMGKFPASGQLSSSKGPEGITWNLWNNQSTLCRLLRVRLAPGCTVGQPVMAWSNGLWLEGSHFSVPSGASLCPSLLGSLVVIL